MILGVMGETGITWKSKLFQYINKERIKSSNNSQIIPIRHVLCGGGESD